MTEAMQQDADTRNQLPPGQPPEMPQPSSVPQEAPAETPASPEPPPPETPAREDPTPTPVTPNANKEMPESKYGTAENMEKPPR